MALPKKILKDEVVDKLRDVEAYTHDDKKRSNNPPVRMAQHDKTEETIKTYEFDPHLDPTLQWAGKAEGMSFSVPTSSIHIHESIKPHKIIRSVQTIGDDYEAQQISMFESPLERMRRRRDAIEFYQHGVNWTNRLIAGDSLIIMNSLLEKEGMAGQVQMVYIDPPYGVKYASNFQPFIDNKNVKERDEDLSQEPEMIKAFRDTWELGIHSYLSYLRNRLLLAKELLSESGSVFVQISDENVHHVKELCDEIFGTENYVSIIIYKKGGTATTSQISNVADFIIWYAKDKTKIKYRQLYEEKRVGVGASTGERYDQVEAPDGTRRPMTKEEKEKPELIPAGYKPYKLSNPCSQHDNPNHRKTPLVFEGKDYYPPNDRQWSVPLEKMYNLIKANRIVSTGKNLAYVMYIDDFPVMPINNIWTEFLLRTERIYVVQTSEKTIERCLLMTTDPGDLVLDITCGSGTTAFVAEQWGRRWITCDTSRVAISLAKQRLMTATFDYYKLAHAKQGVSGGFVYKTVPHIMLRNIAWGDTPQSETLYDQPEIDKTKVRISGPFTVEALPAPVVKPLDDITDLEDADLGAKQTDWRDQLLATGILGRGGNRIMFSRVEAMTGTRYIQADAETHEDVPRRAVVCFAGETKPLDPRMVGMALDEVELLRPAPKLVIFAAFQFDPEAAKLIDEYNNYLGLTMLKVQMNTDLMTEDLKKKRSSDQSFWLVGQPDVELIRDGRAKNRYKVRVNGFDYYDVKKGTVESGNASRIAMWMLDTDYDGMCIEPQQVFFPMGGKNDGWNKLAKTLKAEIDQELIEKYAGNESLWFTVQPNSRIAVKIIDDRGIESLKVLRVGDE